jgi:RHS repeat-associated protein
LGGRAWAISLEYLTQQTGARYTKEQKEYEYDTLNRMTYVRDQPGTALAHYTYDALSRRSDLDYANGAYADYSYDTAGRVLYVDNRTNNGQHKYAYTYDYVGNRSTMMVTTSGGSKTHVYSYDATYQLTHVDYPPELSYLATDTTFHYDAAGNRTSVIDGSGETPYSTNNLNQYTSADGTSFQYDDSGNMTADGTYTYDYDPENRVIRVHKSTPGDPSPTWQPLETFAAYTQGGDAPWVQDAYFAHSGDIDNGQQSWMQIGVEGPGTVKFQWKVSSESGYDYLEFWIDGIQRDAISGITNWAEKTFTVTGAGPHTLKWRYAKDGSESIGEDCGWLDAVQWAGSDPWDNWTTLLYRYDADGRRVEKLYNYETITKYVYDGDHCIAEYDGSSNLQRKYIYGPGVDQPVCMIEAAGSYAGMYYYHFDALGNVVVLTSGNVGSMGNTVEVYDYDVYGRVGATDARHPNRFMFTGREFDKETGLYFYRARYYKPEIGRFLQTDPVGYNAGMNLYRYCKNNPGNMVDPLGRQEEDYLRAAWCQQTWAEWRSYIIRQTVDCIANCMVTSFDAVGLGLCIVGAAVTSYYAPWLTSIVWEGCGAAFGIQSVACVTICARAGYEAAMQVRGLLAACQPPAQAANIPVLDPGLAYEPCDGNATYRRDPRNKSPSPVSRPVADAGVRVHGRLVPTRNTAPQTDMTSDADRRLRNNEIRVLAYGRNKADRRERPMASVCTRIV